ncbi:hypothetical protein L208DRAFT_1395498 [Tricholoma matsutake]|nr:hypothetical protein L208DRAFT_1395498 [Tricholoma matsutake 945]
MLASRLHRQFGAPTLHPGVDCAENKYYNDGVQQDSRQKIQASSDFSLSSYITPPGHRPVVELFMVIYFFVMANFCCNLSLLQLIMPMTC